MDTFNYLFWRKDPIGRPLKRRKERAMRREIQIFDK